MEVNSRFSANNRQPIIMKSFPWICTAVCLLLIGCTDRPKHNSEEITEKRSDAYSCVIDYDRLALEHWRKGVMFLHRERKKIDLGDIPNEYECHDIYDKIDDDDDIGKIFDEKTLLTRAKYGDIGAIGVLERKNNRIGEPLDPDLIRSNPNLIKSSAFYSRLRAKYGTLHALGNYFKFYIQDHPEMFEYELGELENWLESLEDRGNDKDWRACYSLYAFLSNCGGWYKDRHAYYWACYWLGKAIENCPFPDLLLEVARLERLPKESREAILTGNIKKLPEWLLEKGVGIEDYR